MTSRSETQPQTLSPALLEAQQPRKPLLGRILSYGVMLFIVIAILAPIVPIVLWAFSGRWFYPDLMPEELSLRAWEYVFSPASKAGEAALKGGGSLSWPPCFRWPSAYPPEGPSACTDSGASAWSSS